MRARTQHISSHERPGEWADKAAYGLIILLLVAVPLAFTTAVYSIYSLPKFALLLVGAAALVPLLIWNAMLTQRRRERRRLLLSRQVLLVSLYLIVIVISTLLGVSPIAELFGSSYNQMGMLTHVCFFIVFVGLISLTGSNESRFRVVLWAMTLAGLVVATYAFMQFFGKDPFLQSKYYTFESEAGSVLRVNSTLGHSDYLGNFLLYIAPLGVGLGLSSYGSARRLGLAAAGLSGLAILFTGTRGAWVGLIAAVLVFLALARFDNKSRVRLSRRRTMIGWTVSIAIIVILAAAVALSPASRSIALRVRSLGETTGAGRTLLWRDSMKMVKDYALIGSGPEGFRKAFLQYKSGELARLAPGTNNESSHSSYIDAAISYGLVGAVIYAAIITSSFFLLLTAWRRARDRRNRLIPSALMSALVAVAVHNVFIFDQISTGLYFLVLAALAHIASNLTAAGNVSNDDEYAPVLSKENSYGSRLKVSRSKQTGGESQSPKLQIPRRGLASVLFVAGVALFVITAWYAIERVVADVQVNKALASAKAGNLDGVIDYGERVLSHPGPTSDRQLLVARCFNLYADFVSSVMSGAGPAKQTALTETRKRALELAMFHAEQSLQHTLTPDAGYVLLAYLALKLNDAEKLFTYASEAVRLDPNFSNSRWLMAEAYLDRQDREAATREARLAVSLNPVSTEARSALKRATGVPDSSAKSSQLVSYARSLAADGKFIRARRFLVRAIRKARGPCPDCHSALAAVFEATGMYPEAISEWEAFSREAPDRAAAEQTSSRIERLRQSDTRR